MRPCVSLSLIFCNTIVSHKDDLNSDRFFETCSISYVDKFRIFISQMCVTFVSRILAENTKTCYRHYSLDGNLV